VVEHFFEETGTYYRTNVFVPGRVTLVFVHGISGSSAAWAPYEERLKTQFNLLTYDLRGHGMSRKYTKRLDYAMARLVDDLRTLLAGLGIDRCVLVGHSFGVLIALEFLREHQDIVCGAVFVSGEFDAGRRLPAKLLKVLLKPVFALEYFPFRAAPGCHVDYGRYPNSGDWNVPRMLADVANTTWRIYWYCTEAAFTVHAENVLSDLRVPVRLVHGDRDTIFPVKNAFQMAARIRDADVVVLPGADHIIVLNRPGEVADAIATFAFSIAPQFSDEDMSRRDRGRTDRPSGSRGTGRCD
jgi:pimeloyl-ACP methyl ester carboxylesterase